MPASEAQIKANQANAAKSTGPRTEEGKERSRANAYKHGLTATIVLPEREAAEVDRRYLDFVKELKPTGPVGAALVLHATRMSVRMERCAGYESAMLTDRVRQALADYEVPEGIDEAGLAKLRLEVSRRAMFDPSKEATLARKYEAAAERSFLRALKELRQIEKSVKAAEEPFIEEKMGSFSPDGLTDDEFDKLCDEIESRVEGKPVKRAQSDVYSELKGRVDVPFSVGKKR